MADEFGDKTEAPTPRRRQEAREQGNVARSTDLSSAVLLLGMLMMLNWFGGGVMEALRVIMGRFLGARSLGDLSAKSAGEPMVAAIVQISGALAPLFLGGLLIIVLVNMAQVGLNFDLSRIKLNFGALSPLRGLGKIFKGPGLMGLLMNVLKLVLVTWVAWTAVSGRMDQIVGATNLDFSQIFMLGCSLVYSIGVRIAVLLLILALIDYGYQKWRVEKDLMMTKQEVKEEMRRMEGDPKIKQRRRQLALQMLGRKLQKDVPTADVIVTNPTHYAVALKYDSASMNAPRVVAKGMDQIALKIREIAIAHGIPILERPAMARAIYKTCEVGQEIPEQFYAAMAEILAYVYELTGKVKRKQNSELMS